MTIPLLPRTWEASPGTIVIVTLQSLYNILTHGLSFTTIVSGRRRRAKAALHIVKQDQQSAALRLQKTQRYTNKLNQQMQALQKELDQKQTTLELAQQEESWLTTRVQVRAEQTAALETRLAQGWPDEMLLQTLKKKLARQEQTNLQSIPHSTTTRTRTRTAPGTADEDVATVENEAPSPLIQENR
jgi:predicted nuclease with TOPRIM domain